MGNKEEHYDFAGFYEKIKSDLQSYLSNKIDWFKLTSYEKIALAFSHLGFIIIVWVLATTIFFLSIIAIGLTLGEALQNYALGFGLTFLGVILILIVTVLAAKSIRRLLANFAVKIIRKIESNEG